MSYGDETLVACNARRDHKLLNGEIADRMLRRGAEFDLFAAVALGDRDQVERLLAGNLTQVHARRGDGETRLHVARRMRQDAIADALLSHGADETVLSGEGDTTLDKQIEHLATFR